MGPVLCRLPGGWELLLPLDLWRRLTPAGRLAVLRHELAHLKRADAWKSLLVRLLAVPHWFNPAAWWAVHKFDEAAAPLAPCQASFDRLVVAAFMRPQRTTGPMIGSRRTAQPAIRDVTRHWVRLPRLAASRRRARFRLTASRRRARAFAANGRRARDRRSRFPACARALKPDPPKTPVNRGGLVAGVVPPHPDVNVGATTACGGQRPSTAVPSHRLPSVPCPPSLA